MKHKYCPKCKQLILASLEYWYKDKNSKTGLASYCKECQKIRRREYYKKNREKIRQNTKNHYNRNRYTEQYKRRRRKSKLKTYGLTPKSYNILLSLQGRKCNICGIHLSKLKRRLDVDHNHKTGSVRGLLCRNCNGKLGWYEKNKIMVDRHLKGG